MGKTHKYKEEGHICESKGDPNRWSSLSWLRLPFLKTVALIIVSYYEWPLKRVWNCMWRWRVPTCLGDGSLGIMSGFLPTSCVGVPPRLPGARVVGSCVRMVEYSCWVKVPRWYPRHKKKKKKWWWGLVCCLGGKIWPNLDLVHLTWPKSIPHMYALVMGWETQLSIWVEFGFYK